ncbi:MAG: MFS transporter [Chloroflexi bacterium]|nr:MFS transporter [Chloroflexota bacterium]
MKNSRLLPVFLVVFVDLLGFGLILPLLPYYADSYGATPLVVGLLTASYAAAQLLGAPLLGRLSDRFGRRPILLVSIFGTFLGFVLLGVAEPVGEGLANLLGLSASVNAFIVGTLFISRITDGLTGGNISVAQAYITDVTTEKNRAQGLGMIGAAFGLGFIIGPATGGVLSSWGYAVPAFAAAGLALINLVAVYFALPESLTPEKRAEMAVMKAEQPSFSFNALWQTLNRPRVGPLLHIRFFFGLAFATFQTVFALYAQYRLNLDARATGFILTYVGFLSVIVQGFAVGKLSQRFKDQNLILVSTITMGASLLAWAFTPNVVTLLIIMAPLAFAGGILGTVLNSALTKVVYPEEVGGTLGLAASLESLTRVIAPSLGGFLLGQIGAWAPGVLAALIMAWVSGFVWRKLFVNPDPPLPTRPNAVSTEIVV